MTRDDIIRMAREAGLAHFYDSEGHCTGITDASLIDADKDRDDDRLVQMLMPFAALVAAAEREACAMACEDQRDLREEARAALRAADAIKSGDEEVMLRALRHDSDVRLYHAGIDKCAAAIRARGQA
jgi:hypothetical protein